MRISKWQQTNKQAKHKCCYPLSRMETTSEMMIMVKLIMPPAPMPATPRPMIRTVMVGAAPQMRDPVRKKKMAAIIVFFLDKLFPMKKIEAKKKKKVKSQFPSHFSCITRQQPRTIFLSFCAPSHPSPNPYRGLYLPKISLSLPYKGWTAVLVSK